MFKRSQTPGGMFHHHPGFRGPPGFRGGRGGPPPPGMMGGPPHHLHFQGRGGPPPPGFRGRGGGPPRHHMGAPFHPPFPHPRGDYHHPGNRGGGGRMPGPPLRGGKGGQSSAPVNQIRTIVAGSGDYDDGTSLGMAKKRPLMMGSRGGSDNKRPLLMGNNNRGGGRGGGGNNFNSMPAPRPLLSVRGNAMPRQAHPSYSHNSSSSSSSYGSGQYSSSYNSSGGGGGGGHYGGQGGASGGGQDLGYMNGQCHSNLRTITLVETPPPPPAIKVSQRTYLSINQTNRLSAFRVADPFCFFNSFIGKLINLLL